MACFASLARPTSLAPAPLHPARSLAQRSRPLGRRPVLVRPAAAPRRAASQQSEHPAPKKGGVLGVLTSIVTHPFITSGPAIDKLLRFLSCLALYTAAQEASDNFDKLAADPVYFTFIGFFFILTMLQFIVISFPDE